MPQMEVLPFIWFKLQFWLDSFNQHEQLSDDDETCHPDPLILGQQSDDGDLSYFCLLVIMNDDGEVYGLAQFRYYDGENDAYHCCQ